MLTCPLGVVIVDDELRWGHVRQLVLLQGKVPGDWSGRFRPGGGKRRGLGPRNDVLTTCKAVTLRGGQRIIALVSTNNFPGNQVPGMEGVDKWCSTLLRFFHRFLTFLHCRNRALWNWRVWPLLILLKNVTSSSKSRQKKFKGDCDRSRKHNRALMPSLVCLAKQSPDQSETRETVRDKHSRRPLPLPLSSRWTTYDRLRGARR